MLLVGGEVTLQFPGMDLADIGLPFGSFRLCKVAGNVRPERRLEEFVLFKCAYGFAEIPGQTLNVEPAAFP